MAANPPNQQIEDAKRMRTELRLALAQADELMRKAEAVLSRTQFSARR